MSLTIQPTGGGGGRGEFLARIIRLLTVTPKRLNLAHPNLVTFTHIWQNFGKNDSPGELLQLFCK